MSIYDEKLQRLRELQSRRYAIRANMKALRSRYDELEARVNELKRESSTAREALGRLEGRSAAAFFAALTGKKTEKTDAARAKADAAQAEYDAAAKELAALTKELRAAEQDCDRLESFDRRYAAAIEEKAAAVMAAGGAEGQALADADTRINGQESRLRELDEAVAAGQKALHSAQDILRALDSAKDWSTVDLLGGSLIFDIAKHDHLNSAQSQLERLKKELRRFGDELNDVHIDADFQLNIDGFLKFADCFFDGLLANWTVHDRITQSRERMTEVKSRVSSLLDRLTAERSSASSTLQSARSARRRIIEEARLG